MSPCTSTSSEIRSTDSYPIISSGGSATGGGKRITSSEPLLVGVLEELEDVLLLLERLLPHFFADVLNIYKSPEYKKLGNMTGTVHKQAPNLEALQVLYQRMEYEYKFYNFVKAQFHLTKRKIGLRTGPQPSRYYSSVLQRKDLLEELEEEETEDSLNWTEQI